MTTNSAAIGSVPAGGVMTGAAAVVMTGSIAAIGPVVYISAAERVVTRGVAAVATG